MPARPPVAFLSNGRLYLLKPGDTQLVETQLPAGDYGAREVANIIRRLLVRWPSRLVLISTDLSDESVVVPYGLCDNDSVDRGELEAALSYPVVVCRASAAMQAYLAHHGGVTEPPYALMTVEGGGDGRYSVLTQFNVGMEMTGCEHFWVEHPDLTAAPRELGERIGTFAASQPGIDTIDVWSVTGLPDNQYGTRTEFRAGVESTLGTDTQLPNIRTWADSLVLFIGATLYEPIG